MDEEEKGRMINGWEKERREEKEIVGGSREKEWSEMRWKNITCWTAKASR